MEKIVIYKDIRGYQATGEANYNAEYMDARQVMDFSNFSSVQEVINYCIKYFKCKACDFIIIDM